MDAIAAGLDARIDRIINRALQPNPDERYQSAAELAADIDSIRGNAAPRWAFPWKLMLLAGAILLAAIVGWLAPTRRAPVTPATATRETPFVNSLGMRFVPVPITDGPTAGHPMLFSVWETRVKDYEIFSRETHREWPKPDFAQGPLHPAVNVSWNDARAFCAWLTEREIAAGRIQTPAIYRLPNDHEWDCAAGTQKRRFPWGNSWPIPPGAGNYSGSEIGGYEQWPFQEAIDGYRDDYPATAPVGSFAQNPLGLFDIGGNVWELILDRHSIGEPWRTRRGGGFGTFPLDHLELRCRFSSKPGDRDANVGFRCVLDLSPGTTLENAENERDNESGGDSAAVSVAATPAEATKDSPFENEILGYETAFQGDESGFRAWLEGKVLEVTERPPNARHRKLFWVKDGKLHWYRHSLANREDIQRGSGPFEVTEPGTFRWSGNGESEGREESIRIDPGGWKFRYWAASSSGADGDGAQGVVRHDLEPPGRLRAEGNFTAGEEADVSRAEQFNDIVDFFARPHDWIALRANGKMLSSSPYLPAGIEDRVIRRIITDSIVDFALLSIEGEIHFQGHIVQSFTPLPVEARLGELADGTLGYAHGVVILHDGRAMGWGQRYEEAVGDPVDPAGYWTPKWPPAPPAATEHVIDAAATFTHAVTLHEDGSLSAWGWEGLVDMGLPADVGRFTRIQALGDRLFVETTRGELWIIHFPRNASLNPVTGPGIHAQWLGLGSLGRGELWRTPEGRWTSLGGYEGLRRMLDRLALPSTARVCGHVFFPPDRDPQVLVMWIEPVD